MFCFSEWWVELLLCGGLELCERVPSLGRNTAHIPRQLGVSTGLHRRKEWWIRVQSSKYCCRQLSLLICKIKSSQHKQTFHAICCDCSSSVIILSSVNLYFWFLLMNLFRDFNDSWFGFHILVTCSETWVITLGSHWTLLIQTHGITCILGKWPDIRDPQLFQHNKGSSVGKLDPRQGW